MTPPAAPKSGFKSSSRMTAGPCKGGDATVARLFAPCRSWNVQIRTVGMEKPACEDSPLSPVCVRSKRARGYSAATTRDMLVTLGGCLGRVRLRAAVGVERLAGSERGRVVAGDGHDGGGAAGYGDVYTPAAERHATGYGGG